MDGLRVVLGVVRGVRVVVNFGDVFVFISGVVPGVVGFVVDLVLLHN